MSENPKINGSRLAEYGLETPPPVFRAKTLNRAAADAYQGVTTYSRDELFALIEKEHGSMQDIEAAKLGYWRAVVSNSSLDSYFTRMAKSSLQNYAADASSPTVSFQNSHRHNELPVGRSVIGQFVESGNVPNGANPEDFFPAVIVDFFSHRDLQLGDVSVEQFLLGVKTHVIKDVSIGFKEGEGFRYTCNICGGDYWSWDCRHIAGVEYSVSDNPNGDPTDTGNDNKKLCFIWIENARLSEVSAVYDGATPNAMMIKAERESRAGRLATDTKQYLERRFRFRADSKTWLKGADFGGDSKDASTETKPQTAENQESRGQESMADENKTGENLDTSTPKVRAFARELGFEVKDDASLESVIEQIRTSFEANKSKAGKYDELRKQEIETAVSEKVRAEGGKEKAGEGFEEKTRKMLESVQDVETIREFANEWRDAGDKRFGKGRQSQDGGKVGDKAGSERDADDNKSDDDKTENRNAMPDILKVLPPSVLQGGV